jgi:haloalkane dehalogenase
MNKPDWLENDQYPFRLHSIGVNGESITYVDEGEGPTLLFIHAGLWSFVFRDAILRLKANYRCITLDFPGYGLSRAGEGEMPLPVMSEILTAFVDKLELEDVTLVVHDLGGLVGIGAAGSAPERYRGIVLANTFAWTPDTAGLRGMLRLMSSSWVTALDVATGFLPRLTATSFGVGRHLDEHGRAAFLGPFAERSVTRGFHAAMRSALNDEGFTESVERATLTSLTDLPILTIFGERNDPFGFQRRHHATFADHEAVVVRKGNHFPMMDDPELFADSISDWHSRKVQPAHIDR